MRKMYAYMEYEEIVREIQKNKKRGMKCEKKLTFCCIRSALIHTQQRQFFQSILSRREALKLQTEWKKQQQPTITTTTNNDNKKSENPYLK